MRKSVHLVGYSHVYSKQRDSVERLMSSCRVFQACQEVDIRQKLRTSQLSYVEDSRSLRILLTVCFDEPTRLFNSFRLFIIIIIIIIFFFLQNNINAYVYLHLKSY
jgi:hypothetical protein